MGSKITTNSKEYNDSELVIVYDLGMFNKAEVGNTVSQLLSN